MSEQGRSIVRALMQTHVSFFDAADELAIALPEAEKLTRLVQIEAARSIFTVGAHGFLCLCGAMGSEPTAREATLAMERHTRQHDHEHETGGALAW